jgi:hypothetical protein
MKGSELGFKVQVLGFVVYRLEFRIQGLGLEV